MNTLRDVAGALYEAESSFAQTMRWTPGYEQRVKEAELRMNVFGRIRDHRESGMEFSEHGSEEALLKRQVEDLALNGPTDSEKKAAAIAALIKSFAPASEDVVAAEDPVSKQRAAE